MSGCLLTEETTVAGRVRKWLGGDIRIARRVLLIHDLAVRFGHSFFPNNHLKQSSLIGCLLEHPRRNSGPQPEDNPPDNQADRQTNRHRISPRLIPASVSQGVHGMDKGGFRCCRYVPKLLFFFLSRSMTSSFEVFAVCMYLCECVIN